MTPCQIVQTEESKSCVNQTKVVMAVSLKNGVAQAVIVQCQAESKKVSKPNRGETPDTNKETNQMCEFKYSVEQQLRIQILEIMNKPNGLTVDDIKLAKHLQRQLNHLDRTKRHYLAINQTTN